MSAMTTTIKTTLTAMNRRRVLSRAALVLLISLAATRDADAHLNSPDLVHEGMAGPYRLLVTIRPPEVIPGVAVVEVLSSRSDLRAVTMVPLLLRGGVTSAPPVADVATRSPDGSLFRGQLWLMATGSWQVRVHADGPDGAGDLSVPVPALALRTKAMRPVLGAVLLMLLAFLFAGLVSIVGASVREAALVPGASGDPTRARRARTAEIVTALLLLGLGAAGKRWWGSEDRTYREWIYKPLTLAASLDVAAPAVGAAPAPGSPPPSTLSLTLTDPGWIKSRHLDDLLPDHGHLMHLMLVKLPGLDEMAHLHPTEIAPGRFTQPLPRLAAGQYQLFADVVHRTGLAETATTILTVPPGAGGPIAGDDAVGVGRPPAAENVAGDTAILPDGTRVVRLRDGQPLVAGRPIWFRFKVEDAGGAPARDVVPYMGMAGHAFFLTHDRTVFAHVHPSGSVPMAALALTAGAGLPDPHAGHAMHHAQAALPPEIAFPYECPRPGAYRIFVQFKRAEVIETAVFDLRVD